MTGDYHGCREDLITILQDIQRHVADPLLITDGLRPGSPDSSHHDGFAVDIACQDSRHRFNVVHAAILAGVNRIGIYDRHIHLDIDPNRPPCVMWIGVSR